MKIKFSSSSLFLAVATFAMLAAFAPCAAYAYESCDEACPAQDEPGKISFLNGVNQEINCCCVEESEGQAPVSHPIEDCEISPP